jgi:hypothetical protein
MRSATVSWIRSGPVISGAAVVLCLVGVVPVSGDPPGFLVDQSCDGFDAPGFWSLWFYSPMGQEFVPELDRLEVVEFHTDDMGTGSDTLGAILRVDVHRNTIYDPVLGSSDLVVLPHGFQGLTHFEFAAPVPLEPGALHVIELVHVAGDNWGGGKYGHATDICPGGRPIMGGEPMEYDDFWFREGVLWPSMAVPSSWGVIKTLYRE